MSKHPDQLKLEAIKLRNDGYSCKEIRDKLFPGMNIKTFASNLIRWREWDRKNSLYKGHEVKTIGKSNRKTKTNLREIMDARKLKSG